jgi:SSS family solute:Na+ symporter
MIIFFLLTVKWDQIVQALSSVPADASLVNPFRTSQVEDFNFWYFLIGLVGFVYNTMSWQGTQGFNASALSAHESKMAQVLGNWRNFPRNLFLMFIPIVAFTVLHHPDFAALTAKVNSVLGNIDTTEIQSQMRVPLVLKYLLPTGLLGGFAAVMLGAFITTHNSYLHSWGSIFVQDVVMPFRKKPFTPQQHIRLLRGAIAGVAVFIYFFSLIFRQTQHIYLFFAITAAIFVGGSGSVIIGGLYWKRGTTAAAWSAMITGSTIATSGIVLHQIYENFPVNGQWFWGLAMVSSALVYILVSLLGKRKVQDLDKLLHRGKYAIEGEMKVISEAPARGWKVLGMGREFTAGDKFIYVISYAWIIIWTLIFIGGTIYSLSHSIRDSVWMSYWKFYVFIYLAASVIVVIWFTVGGAFDMKAMIRRLRSLKRDERDDGYISS